jgi:hypothetical protein
MSLIIMGEHPLATDELGNLKCRIATIFVRTGTLVTLPGVHATQRFAYTALLNEQRKAGGAPPLSPEEECFEWENAVDLIMEGKFIQIRPDPENMALAFEADRLLQGLEGVSERHIRFLYARQEKVQQAIRERGEYWRVASVPQAPHEIAEMIAGSRIGVSGQPIYYYSMVTGTRYLTLQQFAALGTMDNQDLRRHLLEIRDYAGKCNRLGHRELDFFAVSGAFGREAFNGCDLERASSAEVRSWHREIEARFRYAVPLNLRDDTAENLHWRNLMFSCLIGQRDETTFEEVLRGINPEFFMQIRWLPGGRIEHGELMFDQVFAELEQNPLDAELRDLCDESVKRFICNYVREFGNLEYVNIGHVAPALRQHERAGGHRVYIAEVKHRGAAEPVVRIIRLQKWGIREHIEANKDLLRAIMEAEDYTDYILDRRLGCWQLGMPLPRQIITRRMAETYQGSAMRYHNTRIWTTYFERDYIEGVATDKIWTSRYGDERFALAFARLLGQAAVPNLIVGRTALDGKVIFDDGDEVLVMDSNGIPREIIVADHAGTFRDCESRLDRFAPDYARPVLSRVRWLSNPAAFADAYVSAFSERLTHLQDEYRQQRRTFDTLFKHCKQDPGAFAWRWKKVLARLDQTDVPALVEKIRGLSRPPGGVT